MIKKRPGDMAMGRDGEKKEEKDKIYRAMRKVQTILFILLLSINFIFALRVDAWTVSPVRFEIKAQKGKEYTLTFAVLNESQLYQKRFEIQTDDWTIDKNNNFLRKAFNKEVSNPYSAISWVRVTPQQFVLPPGETKNIRFTVTVPTDLPETGDYSLGIFVGEKNIEKPPKGEKVVHIKQDTFIGVIVYVKIGEEKQDIVLKDLTVDSKQALGGQNKVTLYPVFENTGNVHARGKILVKLEPAGSDGTQVNGNKFEAGEVVVLRGSEVKFPVDIPTPLQSGSEWKFTLNTDFGGNTPIIVGTKNYKVPALSVKGTIKEENQKAGPDKKGEELIKEKLKEKIKGKQK